VYVRLRLVLFLAGRPFLSPLSVKLFSQFTVLSLAGGLFLPSLDVIVIFPYFPKYEIAGTRINFWHTCTPATFQVIPACLPPFSPL
jgi:hypothetical protein